MTMEVDNVIYIGGLPAREKAYPGVKTIYVNPCNDSKDFKFHGSSVHQTAVHYRGRLQDIPRIERTGRSLFVAINSTYYIGDSVLRHARQGDVVFTVDLDLRFSTIE